MNSVDTNGSTTKMSPPPLSVADSQMLQSSLLAMAQGRDAESSGPPALSATPTLSALLRGIRRRWLLAVSVAACLAALTVAAVFVAMPPKYNATIRLRVIAKQAGPEDVEFPILKANMEALVRNPIVLSNALNDKTEDGREIKDLELVRARGVGAIDWLEKGLKTDFLLGPEILRVTLAADQPGDAAELLNAVARAFFKEYAEMEAAKKHARLQELRQKKEILEREINGLRGVLASQLRQLDVKDRDSISSQHQNWQRKLSDAEAAKRTIETEISTANSIILSSNARLKNLDKIVVPHEVLADAYSKDQTLIDHHKRLSEIERELTTISTRYEEPFATRFAKNYKDEKAKVAANIEQREVELQPKIAVLYRKRMHDELKLRIEDAQEKIQICEPQRESEQRKIQEMEKLLRESGAGMKPAALVATEDKIELSKMAQNETVKKMTEVELESPVSRVTPLNKAAAPTEKDISRQTKIAGAGGLGIFVLALFAVGFMEFSRRKIGSAEDVANGLGLKVIGTIPAAPAHVPKPGARDEATLQHWLGHLQESVDAIRTVILHQARHESLHVLLVTSAQSGEGKTTLASQLAASMARAWKRTLIIDADVRHPGLHTIFDAPQEPGLAEVLRGDVEPTDAIRATPVSRLWLLPAGNGDAHAIQALAQDNLRTLFEQLKTQYDIVIIDSPPILPVADSLLIGQHVDGVIYAVLSDVSVAPAVHAAQMKFQPLNPHTLGAVVLGTDTAFSGKPYGYGMSQTAK
jgi:succinoglycan biosynthesis transport protein ExoP